MSDINGSSEGVAPERLKGWKEIGDFLRVHPRTVQRWVERRLGVPVHRISTTKSSIVFTIRTELEVWMHSDEGRNARKGEEPAIHEVVPTEPESPATTDREGELESHHPQPAGEAATAKQVAGGGRWRFELRHGHDCGT